MLKMLPYGTTVSACPAKLHLAMNRVADLKAVRVSKETGHTDQIDHPDRDGVINFDSDQYIKKSSRVEAYSPVVLEAIAKSIKAGYRVVVATNQSGVGRDYSRWIHSIASMKKCTNFYLLLVGELMPFLLPACSRFRPTIAANPQPGMFKHIASTFNADLNGTQRLVTPPRDLVAATAVGCQPILVLTGKGREKPRRQAVSPKARWNIPILRQQLKHF